MLILVGTLPMAYALNRTMPADQALQFAAVAEVTQQALVKAAALTGSIGAQVKSYFADEDHPQPADGLGTDVAGGDPAVG